MENSERPALGTIYDRTYRMLHGIPDVTRVKPATVRTVHPILELSQTFIVESVRHRENGDTVFIEYVSTEGTVRIALPPAVCETIARQRDALTSKNRKQSARAEAARRKAQGILPGFLKKKQA